MSNPASAISTGRRHLGLWFPWLPAERSIRAGALSAAPADAPFALVEKRRGALCLAALDPRAAGLGLTPGMTLADARARMPELATLTHDPVADRALLEAAAGLCDRYTPLVGLDPPDGVTLDVTGCTHLFGGEAGLARDIRRRFASRGLSVRAAFAPSPEGAQALARFAPLPVRDEQAALHELPVAALRLDDAATTALRRAGLYRVGDLAGRRTAPLTARFGAAATLALERLLGRVDSRIVPLRQPPALHFERRFAEPIGHVEQAMAVVGELAAEAAEALAARHAGGRHFVARFYRSDGMTRDLEIATGRPARDPASLMRLFAERMDSLADPIDPGFGFDMIRLAVPVAEPLAPAQPCFDGEHKDEQALDALTDRLTVRLGSKRVRRFTGRDTHIPELASGSSPADRAKTGDWPSPSPEEPALRPLHLFDPPQRIEVVAEVPDGPPRRFRWRGDLHHVARSEGPERISPEWWRINPGSGLSRDYYRVEDDRGQRYWLFRHGLYGRESEQPAWYLHGLFA